MCNTACARVLSKFTKLCNIYPACAHAQQGVKQSVCLSSVVYHLSPISIKIGKFKHLSESMVNKWDKMVKTAKIYLLSRS